MKFKNMSDILLGKELNEKILKGVNLIADAVAISLGPLGRTAIIKENNRKPMISKDGITIAKAIKLNDKFEALGADILKQASESTLTSCGDGPQPLYAKVLTPFGWKEMRNLQIGDTLCGTNNTFQKVLGIFPKGEKEVYEVETFDGRIAECSSDHLWKIKTYYGKEKTLTVQELYENGTFRVHNGNILNKYYIPISSVEFIEENELPLDPYFLGVLLGDGYLGGEYDQVEIALGLKDEYVLEKIKLPSKCFFSKTYDYKKHYIKVRINGVNEKNKSVIKGILRNLGLLGHTCCEKFIPPQYLFSSIENRRKLLEGLIDTDGHINKRGLFEFGTINKILYNDVISLCRSLGIPIYAYKVNRNGNSYSNTPIYRIYQMKGYTHGIKIKNIRKTDKKTEMMCIKVSNDDHLYITDDFIPTHNTTTSIVLARAIINKSQPYLVSGVHLSDFISGMNKAVKKTIEIIKEKSTPITTLEQIEQIATISANGDNSIGKLISIAVDKSGRDGAITIQESRSNETVLDVAEGFTFDSGLLANAFVNDPQRGSLRYEDCNILITDKSISTIDDILPSLKLAERDGKPFIIVAEQVEGQALAALIVNCSKGTMKVAAIKAPKYGEERRNLLADLATVIGATFISRESGINFNKIELKHFGNAKIVESNKFITTIVSTGKNQIQIDEKITGLKELIKSTESIIEAQKIQDRLNRLASCIAIIKVGGATEVEMIEKKHRIEDAISAVLAAQLKGIVAGGGSMFLRISKSLEGLECNNLAEKYGIEVVSQALQEPFRQIIKNSSLSFDLCLEKINSSEDWNLAYDVNKCLFGDLIKLGIIDPSKVLTNSLQNAFSAASTLLSSSVAIVE